jgi:Recombinase
VSGASLIRPGIQGLLGDALRGRFDVVPLANRYGERRMKAEEAEIVHHIFRDFAAGISPRGIAVALNKEGVPGPLVGSGATPPSEAM